MIHGMAFIKLALDWRNCNYKVEEKTPIGLSFSFKHTIYPIHPQEILPRHTDDRLSKQLDL